MADDTSSFLGMLFGSLIMHVFGLPSMNQASPRGGVLDLVLEEEKQRLRIRGEAVTVMTGTLLV